VGTWSAHLQVYRPHIHGGIDIPSACSFSELLPVASVVLAFVWRPELPPAAIIIKGLPGDFDARRAGRSAIRLANHAS
jgi:hypothetical protein